MASLNFDWEIVAGSYVAAIIGRNERRMNDASFAWDKIAFVLGQNAVILTVSDDTDEVIVNLSAAPTGDDWLKVAPLNRFVSKQLGWCWEVTNYLGYSDGFIVAFGDVVPDALEPNLTFLGEGAAITCFQMAAIS